MSKEMGFRLGALGCFLLYILSFLLLPYLMLRDPSGITSIAYGCTGADCFSVSGWSYLVLIAGIAAAVCTLVVPAKPAAGICLGASVVALITFFLIRMHAASAGGGGWAVTRIVNSSITVGFGLVLCILCGIGAAVLCFLSEYASTPVKHTPGLTADPDDDW